MTVLTAGSVLYNLGPIDTIPMGEGRTYQIEHTSVAIFRTRENALFATQSTCPHKRGPLADGIVGANKIVCPLHSYKFDLTTGSPVGNTCIALKTYSVTVDAHGNMLLALE